MGINANNLDGGLLHMEFSSQGELRNWLELNYQGCDSTEEFDEWLEQFFDDGNTVTVGDESYDCDDCWGVLDECDWLYQDNTDGLDAMIQNASSQIEEKCPAGVKDIECPNLQR